MALSHPQVLWAAWLRIDTWYRSAELAPQPELALWRLHPEAKLRELRDELREDRWHPSAWLQVPYPKKGARLRHYTVPTVTDQVAFMAHMVLLGPLLDSRIESFAFGNRWYRPLVWNHRGDPPCWEFRQYPLLSGRIHRPFASSHGLYKRVANWTIARLTGARERLDDDAGASHLLEDYSRNALPPWLGDKWWCGGQSEENRAAWATLDVQLAYPSVRLDHLERNGTVMLAGVADDLTELIIGYPRHIREALNELNVRQRIWCSLVGGLRRVEIKSSDIAEDTWRPFHASPTLPPHNKGLPTGLAISGMLMNVAFHHADHAVRNHLKKLLPKRRGAFVRFADDMVVLSCSLQGLMDLIDAVWKGLANDAGACLAAGQSTSNLYLGFGKIAPDPVRDLVEQYFKDQGWKQCDKGNCDQLVRSSDERDTESLESLGAWWIRVARADREHKSLRRAVERAMVGPREVGPFVTTLVTRLSDIARDTLSERFGEGARYRLSQLHDLARLDIDDRQVRAETRRAFAVNRLVRAWLPGNRKEAQAALAEIRVSIAHVLKETPWKFSLWRAVVRAAARRPPQVGRSDTREDDDLAAKWMSEQLRRIAYHATDPSDRMSWMYMWPEEDDESPHGRDFNWRHLYLSFLRAAFWRGIADTLGILHRHQHRIQQSSAGKIGRPSSQWWTVRAIPEGGHVCVIRLLGGLDRWVDKLYPRGEGDAPPDLRRWPWELDQLVAATIAAHPGSDLVEAWRYAESPEEHLMVPAALSTQGLHRTFQIIKQSVRVCSRVERPHYLNESALAHVGLAERDERLGPLLFPRGGKPRILQSGDDLPHMLMIAEALGCSENVDRNLAAAVIKANQRVDGFYDDPLTLREYAAARRIMLGSGAAHE